MNHQYTSDHAAGKQIRAELESYMAENIWREKDKPLCAHYDSCKKSCDAENRNFGYGQLPHIGENYALQRNGKDFRVIVSAAEVGSAQDYYRYQSIDARTKQITDCVPDNGHMRGTLVALQMLFGTDVAKETMSMRVGDENAKILSAFALPNFLLCSAPFGNDGIESSAYTKTTRANCAEHFHAVLRILKPNIFIALGNRPHNYFGSRHNAGIVLDDPKVHKIEIDGHPCLMLPMYHPSAQQGKTWSGWGYGTIDSYVKPNIAKLLAEFDNAG